MRVIYDQRFIDAFINIWNYIAQDSKSRANSFERSLKKNLKTLPHMPYKYRQSIHNNNENIRDYIFKGYTIPYLVDEGNDVIVVLDMFKWVKKELLS